jgi:hypothetical protein
MSATAKRKGPIKPPPDYTPEFVLNVSEAVYRIRLGGPKEVADMIANDKDQGQKLRSRAGAYDALTRAYLKVIKEMLP